MNLMEMGKTIHNFYGTVILNFKELVLINSIRNLTKFDSTFARN